MRGYDTALPPLASNGKFVYNIRAMKKIILTLFVLVVIAGLLGAGAVNWCWKNRDTAEKRRDARKAVAKELREMPAEGVLPYLVDLRDKKSLHVWFEKGAGGEECPCRFWTLRAAFQTRVPYDVIGQQTENMIIRFAGNDKNKPDVKHIKDMIAFSETLLPLCTKDGAISLTERRLDGFFLVGDYDSAISLLESGKITSRTPAWCKGTAAKLRAHKAMDAKNNKEAISQLQVFIDFMLSDEQKDFEDCDPTTGIFYSREWVVARNYMRCFNMATEMKDAAKAAEFKELAKKNFAIALQKAKDDQKSLPILKEEAKSVGL